MSNSRTSLARFLPATALVIFSSMGPTSSLANEAVCTVTTVAGASIQQAKQQFAASCPNRVRKDCDPLGNKWQCSTASLPLSSSQSASTSISPTAVNVPTPSTTVTSQTGAVAVGSVLTIQAENPSQISGSGWSTERTLGGYQGSAYIVWRGVDDFRTSDAAPPAGINAYDFTVTQPGTYKFIARVQARVGNGNAANDKDNDGWVKFTSGSATANVRGDASKWTKFYVSGGDENWKNYSRGEQYGPTFFTDIQRDLPAGTHRVLIGGRSARFAIDSVGLQLLRATGANQPVVSAPVAPQAPVVIPTPGQTTPVPTPTAPTVQGACTARGDNLLAAKRNYAQACPRVARQDCDPVAPGGWMCSSEKFGANATIRTIPQPAPPQSAQPTQPQPTQPDVTPVVNNCTAEGPSLGQAKVNYANSCAAYRRIDCDPIGGGRWQCSSGVIGKSAPSIRNTPYVATQPVPTQPTTPVPTTPPMPTTPSAQPTTPLPPPAPNAGTVGLISTNDLLALHYDNCPDRDDGHAIVAGKAVIDAVGIQNVLVVNGTCGADIRWRYQPSSVNVLRAVWGNNWLDGFNQQDASVSTAAQRWAATLANGDDVWVAEGGPSDFTANVLRRIGEMYPSIDRKRVRVVQHSAGATGWNEKNTSPAGIALVKRVADYRPIPDGNVRGNGSADFHMRSTTFVNVARQSRYANEWSAAFNYLDPNTKIDFSDTVEILYIVNDKQTLTIDNFANRYLR